METVTKVEFSARWAEMLERISQGDVFIHPTDTIYGLGCSATDEKAVKKIRQLKERPDTPFSVWAPSKEWIVQNCEMTPQAREWLAKLPGPYTVVLKLKKKSALAKNVNPQGDTIGVRLPDHWFSRVVGVLGVPMITTSANKTGKNFMTSLETLDVGIKNGVSFIVYEGEKDGRPSKIVDATQAKPTVKER